jgi:protease IV
MIFRLILNILGNFFLLFANIPRLLRLRGRPRWVRLPIKSPLPSRPPPRAFLARAVHSLASLTKTVEELAADEDLTGVVIELGHLPGGWARLRSVRALLLHLRGRGKRVVAHLSSPTLREIYVASAADQILIDESGPVGLTGIAAEVTFWAGAFEKLGVEAQVAYRGAYKSFAETFSRTDMSPAHREALELILDRIEGEVTTAFATGRKLDETRARQVLTGGPYAAAGAVQAGVADGVRYRDEVHEDLGIPERALGTLARWQGARLRPFRWRPLFRTAPRIRVVSLHGAIVPGEGSVIPRNSLGGDAAVRVLEAARKARRVKAVVLHIDSRGGSAAASDLIWREVVRLAKAKPVVAYLDDVAASGGYYIACAASKIVAQPTTLTGSIGVVAGKLAVAGLYEKLGLRAVILRRGEASAMHLPTAPYSDEERRRLTAEVDALYQQFVGKVAAGRKLAAPAAEAVAQGRVWSGLDAAERGLVDQLGDVDAAIALARQLAGQNLAVEDTSATPRRGRLLSLLGRGQELAGVLAEAALLGEERHLLVGPHLKIG